MNHRHKDVRLFVLVADQDMEQAIRGLLGRPEFLEIGPVSFEAGRHPRRDSGCRTGAVEYLRPFLNSYSHAIVVFDLDGSGSHRSRIDTQCELEIELGRNGWENRAKVIVIEPELEAWVWAASDKVPEVLGWETRYGEVRRWLRNQGLWPLEQDKPPDPKEAMERVMRMARSRKSPRKFFELASVIDVAGCQDPAFGEFLGTLREWFPPHPRQ